MLNRIFAYIEETFPITEEGESQVSSNSKGRVTGGTQSKSDLLLRFMSDIVTKLKELEPVIS